MHGNRLVRLLFLGVAPFTLTSVAWAQESLAPIIQLKLDGNVRGEAGANHGRVAGDASFATGIAGQALDLTASAPIRFGVDLGKPEALGFGEDRDFSVLAWVKSNPGARGGNAIVTNQDWTKARQAWPNQNGVKTSAGAGWTIASHPSGSWAWSISDGRSRFDYEPTANRQPINDGRWHQLAFTVNRDQREARLYYDGLNVAIYHLGGLGALTSELSTTIGASGSAGENEMFSFDGMIDEVAIWGRSLSAPEVRSFYAELASTEPSSPGERLSDLKVMAFNIWHGGREHGEVVGVQRIIDVIRDADPDVIAMVETYGSGPKIADALGYYFYLRSTNLSIMSRFPIGETFDVYRPFNAGGARINLSPDQAIAFFPIWINNVPSSRREATKPGATAEALIAAEQRTRGREIQAILSDMAPMLARSEDVPVILAGDFNSASHQDWIQNTAHLHNGLVVDWPVSRAVTGEGMTEAYREVFPDAATHIGLTHRSGSRIDYIYYKGRGMRALDAAIIREHPRKFPSDHYAVTATLKLPSRR